ncbi:DUF790 family protein [Saccharolobus shibatae]|uniref:DUF790 family protein n=1 Tax=Saccharolobus shibatae TaxID=2286 RepID=A0A8F5GXL0_9CREN|nr:DUF790 family protein [Saccharolobus shibatae]QXJ33254.1 hypothetical protein J5U21_02925 [Saccharolobus shibatae]QXJ36370.1 hypothetical protein J5U22_02937 [Saccharolobus shibatae]
MLTSDLARFKIENQRIIPLFATDSDIDVAKEVIDMFKIGAKVGDILEDLKYLSKIYDYKLVKGLGKIYLRYCTVESATKIDYIELRRQLFSKGPVLDENDKERVLKEISDLFHVDPIKAMYEDLDVEKKIVELPKFSPEDLLKIYNLSLLQTIIFNAYKVTVSVSDGWKEIARRIKMLGLMYLAYENPLRIEIFGPLSLVKMTEKYGRNLAALVPFLVSKNKWTIIADIVLGKSKRRTYRLELSSGYSKLFKYINDEEMEKRFDSSIEEKFYEEFRRVIRDWNIVREPEPIVIGKRLYFPDFVLSKGNIKVYVEIMGFWTKEYVNSKIEKLRNFKYPILVLLNEELSYENYIPDILNVIKFKKKIDIGKLYSALRRFQANVNEDIDLSDVNDDIILIKELSAKYNVDEKIVRSKLMQRPDYIVLKNYAIKKTFIEELKKEDFSNTQLSSLVNKYGNYIVDVIDYLGYKIVWKNISDAIVEKIKEV